MSLLMPSKALAKLFKSNIIKIPMEIFTSLLLAWQIE